MSLSPLPRPRGRLGTLLTALSAAVLFAAVTGCSALGGSDAPAEDAGGSANGLEHPNLKVGLLPIVDVAPVQRAKSAGYFAAEGLNVDLPTVQGGAVAVPQLVSGDLDLTWTGWTSVFLAQTQKVADLRVINVTYQAAPNCFLVLARPESGIRTPQDLVGKKIAINTFTSITELIARSSLQANGVDPKSVQYVEIPFPEMNAALTNHQVDAIVILEPYLTQAETAGAVTVLDATSGPTNEIPIGGLATTAGFAEKNPKTLAAFQRAVGKAQAEMTDRSIVEQTLPTYTKITADTAPLLNLGTWPATVDATHLQRVSDLMTQFGMLSQPFDVAPLLPSATG